MIRFRRTALSALALGVVTVPSALASAPLASTDAQPSTHITVDKPFDIVLDSKGNADTAKLPTVSTLFTKAELAQVIPGLTASSVNNDTQTLTIKGDSSSTMQIVLKRFGKKDTVDAAWKKEKAAHEKRAQQNPGLYTFFGSRLGATDAFTDGTNTHVEVTNGDAAGEIWFSGSGFTQLGDDYASSRSTYTTKVVPALVRLIADKLHDGAAKEATASAAKKATTTPTG